MVFNLPFFRFGLAGPWKGPATALIAVLLVGCASGPDKPKPAELPPVTSLIDTQRVWSAQMGASQPGIGPVVAGQQVLLSNAAGLLSVRDALTGQERWRYSASAPLAAAPGSDGEHVALVTLNNDLVVVREGQERWRARLGARVFTPPWVAGQRVFVLLGDRSLHAYDASNGARLWTSTRVGDPLVLRQAGVLLAVGDTLVAGQGGRLAGLNPLTGDVRWEATVASPRGSNEVERLVDLVGPAHRQGSMVCARAFSAAVGCVDAQGGRTLWSRPHRGVTGLHGDTDLLFGAETDGQVIAWRRAGGEPVWRVDRLRHRGLSAPLAVGRVVAVGDDTGLLHLLSREDGSEMTRLVTDGSAVVGAPVIAGDVLLVQTRNGGVYAWRPR